MIWRLILSLMIALACGRGFAAGDAFFQPSFGDFHEELATAKAQGKQGLLLVFEQDGCPYCRRLREQVLSRQDVQQWYRQHFIAITVDVLGALAVTDVNGDAMDERALARRYAVRATPTLVFIDTAGRTVLRHAGAPRDAEAFLLLGRYVADGAVNSMTLDQYRQAAGAAAQGRKQQ